MNPRPDRVHRCPAANRLALLLLASGWPALLSGCQASLAGDWRLARAVPSREVFCLEDIHFDRQGEFAATVTLDGRTARETGTYQFTGFHLTLHPAAGGQRRYDAHLKLNRLEVRRGSSLVVLERGKSRNASPPPRGAGSGADNPPADTGAAPRADDRHVIHEGAPPQP